MSGRRDFLVTLLLTPVIGPLLSKVAKRYLDRPGIQILDRNGGVRIAWPEVLRGVQSGETVLIPSGVYHTPWGNFDTTTSSTIIDNCISSNNGYGFDIQS